LTAVHAALKAAYPRHIVDQPTWLWNNVGGVFGRMAIISCSLTEYVVLFGTSTPQSGFSGYYTGMDVRDIMITGTMQSFGASPTAANPLVYTAEGRQSLLERKDTRYYTMDAYTYMLEYGHGSIPSAFWQGIIAPYLFTSHDWTSLRDQLGVCAEQILPLLRRPHGATAETPAP
jgi:C-8 sterol isomerase